MAQGQIVRLYGNCLLIASTLVGLNDAKVYQVALHGAASRP